MLIESKVSRNDRLATRVERDQLGKKVRGRARRGSETCLNVNTISLGWGTRVT